MPIDLDAYNVLWDTPSVDAGESMPCGGGDVGLNVWVEAGELFIYLARSGTFDELNTMPKLGRVRVAISPSPFAAGATFRQELLLRRGCIRISGKTDEIHAEIDVWVDVHRPVAHVQVKTSVHVILTATYESWRLAEREFAGAETHSARSWTGASERGIARPDAVEFADGGVRFVHRNAGRTAFDLIVEQQGLCGIKEQLWDPLKNLTFGGSMRGRGMSPAGIVDGKYASTPFRGWRLTSDAPALGHNITVAMHIDPAATLADWHTGLSAIERDADESGEAARLSTEAWWRDFWERSHVAIHPSSPNPNDPAWQAARNYQLFRYQLGCNATGAYPTKFNGGLFTFDPEFVDPKRTFSPDFRQWGGGSFTAQNQRLVYWPTLKNGDVELMRPQFEFYRRALVNAMARAKLYWNIDGACFTEQIENSGLPVGFEYGWKRTPEVEPGIEDSAWVSHQWDTVFEFCRMILDARDYAGFDIQPYLELIESCLRFYDEFYQRKHVQRTGERLDPGGKLVLFPATALETYKNALNPTPTICSLRGVLRGLFNLPDHILPAGRRQHWAGMLVRIPEIATRKKEGKQTISPAWKWSHKQNCELPQLYPVYPWGEYGVGRPDLSLAIDTWNHGADAADQKQTISWHQDPIFCARLGLTDEAAKLMLDKLKDSPRRFPTFWGPGHDWVPDHNWGGSGMIALQEMLLQVVDEKLYILPAWPREWDVSFKLHAPGGTAVELELVGGVLRRLEVIPEPRRSDVILPTQIHAPSRSAATACEERASR